MKNKVYAKEFKDMILQEVNEANNVAQVARRHELSTKTIYNWRKQSNHKAWRAASQDATKTIIYTPTPQEFKELEGENGQFKKILGEKDSGIVILRDLIKKSQSGYRTRL